MRHATNQSTTPPTTDKQHRYRNHRATHGIRKQLHRYSCTLCMGVSLPEPSVPDATWHLPTTSPSRAPIAYRASGLVLPSRSPPSARSCTRTREGLMQGCAVSRAMPPIEPYTLHDLHSRANPSAFREPQRACKRARPRVGCVPPSVRVRVLRPTDGAPPAAAAHLGFRGALPAVP